MSTYDLGDVAQLSVTIRDSTGAAANATAVALTVTTPAGVASTPTVNNTATGVYQASYTPAAAGRYTVRWVATGTNASAYTDVFTVADPADLPVVSLSDTRAHLNITATTGDEELRRLLTVACDVGEAYTGRVFGRRSVVEAHAGGARYVVLRRIPVLSTTTVVEDGTSVAAAGYSLDTQSGCLLRLSSGYPSVWAGGVDAVVVTYTAGYAAQPESDIQGVLEMVRHLWETQRGSMPMMPRGDEGWTPGLGYSIPKRVAELWDGSRVPGFA